MAAATVHYLQPRSRSFSGFLRVGHTGHRKLEALLAVGRLPFNQVVFEGAHIAGQSQLLASLSAAGREVVLDPNFAEMTLAARFSSSVRRLPWAHPDRPWQIDDLHKTRNREIAKRIAEFAIGHGVQAILAPTHFIEPTTDSFLAADAQLCEVLRAQLDQAGGSNIGIDYPLITTTSLLRDERSREVFARHLRSLPVQNVWLRIAGFGADATGVGTRHYIEAVRSLHEIQRPLVADATGGFAGLAAGAFGAVGAICHGVGQRESFRASDWKKAPRQDGGGSTIRIYVPDLDRHLTEDQIEIVFAARNGRARFICNDTSCCPGGREDMIENAHAHFLAQRHRQIDALSQVPEAKRAEHFLRHFLDSAVRSARFGAALKVADERVAKVLAQAKSRLVRLRDALDHLQANDTEVSWSATPDFRGTAPRISAGRG